MWGATYLYPFPINGILSLKYTKYVTHKVYTKGGFRFLNSKLSYSYFKHST
jgi:hypothetical protein